MTPSRLSLILAAISWLGLTACQPREATVDPDSADREAGASLPSLPVIQPAPDWTMPDLNGQPVRSDQFKGKVVVVDFWATWCGPCREEIPGYIALQEKYGKDGLVIIGVSLDRGGPAKVAEFAKKFGINYQLVMGDSEAIAGFGDISAIPTTFLIDRQGNIRDRKVGALATAEYEKRIRAVLK